MELTLTTKDRFVIPALLPLEGTMKDQMLSKIIRDKIAFTSKELDAMDLTSENKQLVWKKEIDHLEKEFTPTELDFMKERIDVLDKEEKILSDQYETFNMIKNYEEKVVVEEGK